jgi:hypothetical protein
MLEWERFVAEQEAFNEGMCRETRLNCGLEPDTGVTCDEEPCKVVCPFLKMR